jgi:hypothetical protein
VAKKFLGCQILFTVAQIFDFGPNDRKSCNAAVTRSVNPIHPGKYVENAPLFTFLL